MPIGSMDMLPSHHDDKHAKFAAKGTISKSADIMGAMSLRGGFSNKEVAALLRSPLQAYTVFLMAGSILYYMWGGNIRNTTTEQKLGFFSTIIEGFGLLSLAVKINQQGSVTGISGMTMAMYSLTYTLREAEMLIVDSGTLYHINGLVQEILQIVSLLISFSILRSVFFTYRSSYQLDLDVMKFQYLVLGCLAFALVIHPTFDTGFLYMYCWTSAFYIDVMALLPQVVMMAKGNGLVEAPISNFVAATAISRSVDLFYWYFRFDLGPQGYWFGVNYSGWLIVLFHVLNLVFVADFMYYFMKARFSGSKLSADLAISEV